MVEVSSLVKNSKWARPDAAVVVATEATPVTFAGLSVSFEELDDSRDFRVGATFW